MHKKYILKGVVAVTSTLCLTVVVVLQADKEHSRPPIDSPTPADLGLTSVDQTLVLTEGSAHLVGLPTNQVRVLLLICSTLRCATPSVKGILCSTGVNPKFAGVGLPARGPGFSFSACQTITSVRQRVEVTANHAQHMLQHVRAVLCFCRASTVSNNCNSLA